MKRQAGVLVPLFSVYSKKSTGIGDLNDLKLLIDWCSKTTLSILQLLPMNEVGTTFCPYDSVSSFALDPMYISIGAFPVSRTKVDYTIKEKKINLLKEIYRKAIQRDSGDFRRFVKENKYWLDDFALYKVLKDYQSGRPWYEWEERYKNRDMSTLDVFKIEHKEEMAFQKWLQHLAFTQFKELKDYAVSKKIKICGDLPILTSRDSADVWAHPEFFKLEFAAGAPPDMYCAKGQRWGMPTYDWERIEADGYRYLKEKLKFAENFYDMLRIDHVVGLFRIWSIPYNEPAQNEGLNGFFDPKDEALWKEHGRRILSVMLKSTNMVLLAEDLGIIPKVCPDTLKELHIPGNDVQRWTKDWKVKHDFLEPKEYRQLSVAMLSTHDTTNWTGWWENEAGTVDEALFVRKCLDRKIDYPNIKEKLFNPALSRHSRLRWRDDVDLTSRLVEILGKREEEVKDFIELYENTYREKEKLWKHLKLGGAMREKWDKKIVRSALNITLESRSVFSIELLIDYLYLTDILKGDPYQYRINRPGTVSRDNWSLVIPIALEDLLKHKVCKEIRSMISSSGRL